MATQQHRSKYDVSMKTLYTDVHQSVSDEYWSPPWTILIFMLDILGTELCVIHRKRSKCAAYCNQGTT